MLSIQGDNKVYVIGYESVVIPKHPSHTVFIRVSITRLDEL